MSHLQAITGSTIKSSHNGQAVAVLLFSADQQSCNSVCENCTSYQASSMTEGQLKHASTVKLQMTAAEARTWLLLT
jgi:hypothetical protein